MTPEDEEYYATSFYRGSGGEVIKVWYDERRNAFTWRHPGGRSMGWFGDKIGAGRIGVLINAAQRMGKSAQRMDWRRDPSASRFFVEKGPENRGTLDLR